MGFQLLDLCLIRGGTGYIYVDKNDHFNLNFLSF